MHNCFIDYGINNKYNKKKVNVKKKLNNIYTPPKYNFKKNPQNYRKLINNKKNRIAMNINKNLSSKNLKKHSFENNIIYKGKNKELNFNELNHLSFRDAVAKDNRTFFQYYLSLLKTNHLILNIFYSQDYNSQAIKISIFIFNLASSIAINSLFFNDSTMHKIYTDHGSFDFLYQLPQIIYSTIISTILNFLINIFGLSEPKILKIKNGNILEKDVNKKFNNLFRVLRINFILFFIIDFVILFLYWYYITCFCGIYRNTQIHLLKDSLCSFVVSLITPFFIYIIPGVFRTCALKSKNKLLYKFSQILQTI